MAQHAQRRRRGLAGLSCVIGTLVLASAGIGVAGATSSQPSSAVYSAAAGQVETASATSAARAARPGNSSAGGSQTAAMVISALSDHDWEGGVTAGDPLTYSVMVANTGATTLKQVTVMETEFSGSGAQPNFETGSCWVSSWNQSAPQPKNKQQNGSITLEPDQWVVCAAKQPYQPTDKDAQKGSLLIRAAAKGTDPAGQLVSVGVGQRSDLNSNYLRVSPAGPSPSPDPTPTPTPTKDSVPVYRLFNPNTGEHFYTVSAPERDVDVKAGWHDEGTLEDAPTAGSPIYRLFNPGVVGGDHYYTTSQSEARELVARGWRLENGGHPAFYSGGDVNVYVAYNPNARSGAHNFTTSLTEQNDLLRRGWTYGKTAWKAMKPGHH